MLLQLTAVMAVNETSPKLAPVKSQLDNLTWAERTITLLSGAKSHFLNDEPEKSTVLVAKFNPRRR